MHKPVDKDYDYFMKLLVIGNPTAGKSNLILRYTENTFQEGRLAVDFKARYVILHGKKIKLHIWDMEPINRFRDTDDYTNSFRGVRGIVIVYDISNKETFDNVRQYLDDADRYARENTCKILVGAKSDLHNLRVVTSETAQEFAHSHGMQYFETSAKMNINVDSAFVALTQEVFDQMVPYIVDPNMQKLQVSGEGPLVTIAYSGTNTIALQAINPWELKGVDADTIYYYEVAIKSVSSGFNVGLAASSFPVLGQSLGLLPNSYGYYGEDGSRIINEGYIKTGWPKLKKGMVVGIGLVVASHKIFGTLDGKLLGDIADTTATQLVPTIGFHKAGEVQVIFETYKHKFSLSSISGTLDFRNIDETSSKLLVLFCKDPFDLALREKMQKSVEGASKTLAFKYGYQTCFSFTHSAKASELRKKFMIDSPHALVAINFKKGSHFVFPKDTDCTTKNILEVFSTFMEPISAPRSNKDQNSLCPALVQVVAATFNDLVLVGTKDVLLHVYNGDNLHRETLEILAEVFATNENIVIAQIDSVANELHPNYFPVNCTPRTKFFCGYTKHRPLTYTGNETIESLVEFLHAHSRLPFDLKTTKEKAREIADLRQLREILERRHKKLANLGNSTTKDKENDAKIQEVDKLLLQGISPLTQPPQDSGYKKELAMQFLSKAFNLLDQEKLTEAKCYLEMSSELDKSAENEKLMLELQAQIKDREKLSEHELQMRVEERINTIKADIVHAEQQAQNVKTQAEREMIEQQLAVLHQQEEKLQGQITVYEARNQKLQERETQVEQQEQLLNEQTVQLEQLLAELVSTTVNDVSALKQQMANVVAGDKDVDSARRRFASMQKAAKDAQQALVVEERRQRERVEWLQKQMDLYQVKGMSPSQLAFRNFLKDIKRLSAVRHQLEHTPHPLRCFISYAWETDPTANKELQKRLQRLKDELETAGMEVMLDIRDMKFDMKRFMVQNIDRSHKLLLICTPRLQIRAVDAVKNNLQLELETALDKEKTTQDFIIPLILSGTFHDAMPPQVGHLLSINLTSPSDHYSSMASLAPMGLIPMLLGLERHKDYKRIHDRLLLELSDYNQTQI